MKGYFAQIVQTQDGKLALAGTGMITGHAGETVMIRFNGAPPRTKLLPAHHPLIQSLEIFDSTDDLKLFVDQQFKKPETAPAPKQTVTSNNQRGGVTALNVNVDPAQEEELEAEFTVEEEEQEAPPVKQVQEDEEDRETARARRRARSNIWQVKWKGDMDDTYVTGCSSPREVKGKITQVFGPQNDSSYLSITRVLNDEVPDDRTTI